MIKHIQLWLQESASESQRREKDINSDNETDGDTFLERIWDYDTLKMEERDLNAEPLILLGGNLCCWSSECVCVCALSLRTHTHTHNSHLQPRVTTETQTAEQEMRCLKI